MLGSGGRLATLMRRHLRHTATLTPVGSTAVDADNQPIVVAGVPLPLLPCRFVDRDVEQLISAQEAGVQKIDALLIVEPSTPIAKGARVTAIANERGEALAPGTFVVTEVVAPRLDTSAFRVATLEQLS